MVNRYQEPYLFALSPISSMRSFAWTLEDKGTQEGRQLKCHHTSPHVLGVIAFRIYGDFAVHTAKKGTLVNVAVIPKRHLTNGDIEPGKKQEVTLCKTAQVPVVKLSAIFRGVISDCVKTK